MAVYQYQAVDARGRQVTGQVEAHGVEHAAAVLLAQGLTAHSITPAVAESPNPPGVASGPDVAATGPAVEPPPSRSAKGIEESVLRSHMATILSRGRVIVPALRAYAAEIPGRSQRRQLLAVCRILERGEPADAAKALANLPESWIPLLSAATTSPDAGRVLHDFLAETRRAESLRQQWWLTLAYPILLVCLAITVLTTLSIIVIPQFREIFNEFDLALPRLTNWVLVAAFFFSAWGFPILLAFALLFVAIVTYANSSPLASVFARLADWLHLPFGRRTSVARFARFLADLIEAGVSVPDALRIAGFSVYRVRMKRAAWRMAHDLEATGSLSSRAYCRPLSATVVYALAADLPPESRIRLLREISNCHADRVRINLSWASGLVEPIAIAVVGMAVGITVVGLFLPLMNLIEVLTM